VAAKYGLPVICLIDTPGAYPGVGAEERGQAQVIAESMFLMASLPVPIVCVVIGEGGSGGALGIGVGDRVAMLEHAYYSVISPEGCAGILWKSVDYKADAARALRFRSRDLEQFGVVDAVIEEPAGGAHRHPRQMAMRLKTYLARSLRELVGRPADMLLADRYERFRTLGVFVGKPAVPVRRAGAEPAFSRRSCMDLRPTRLAGVAARGRGPWRSARPEQEMFWRGKTPPGSAASR